MHKDRIKDPDMLSMWKRAAINVAEIVLMVVFGTLALWVYGSMTSNEEVHRASSLSYFELKTSFLFSLSFMALSGFFISVILIGNLRNFQMHWKKRAATDCALLILHVAIFIAIFANDLSVSDVPLVILGMVVVVISEAATGLVWSKLERASGGA